MRPDAELVALRTLVRYRANQMQSALKVMNIQLSDELTDVTGKTGTQAHYNG